MNDHVAARARDLDVVVYGATGFVGALVAEHLAAHAPQGTRIGLAGRSAARLGTLQARLRTAWPQVGDWPLLVADAADPAALDTLANAAHVVLTTVGPYAKYGRGLAHACAAAGTDYLDLTGEVLFARASADDNHELARATGARIVHSAGFDSVPSDLGVHVLYERVRADDAGELGDTTLVVTEARGGVSGGTIDSLRHQLDQIGREPGLARVAADPYALSPAPGQEPDLGPQPDLVTLRGPDVDATLRGTLARFVMAPYNTRVVRRSNALRGWAYGKRFRYREVISVGASVLSPLLAAGMLVGLGALAFGLSHRGTRQVLDRLLPKPGDGPDQAARRAGHFTVEVFTTTTTGARYAACFAAQGDPGYAATAVMIGEAALALAVDRDGLPDTPGGVLTPATGIGDALVRRLRAAGMRISVRGPGNFLNPDLCRQVGQ